MSRYVFRLDDIAPNMDWERLGVLEAVFRRHHVRPLIGVIPDNQDPELLAFPRFDGDFWQRVREWVDEGWEVALHGYRHLLDSPSAGLLGLHARSEFAGLDLEVQRERLHRGLELLREQGVQTDIFMPPAHSFDRVTLRAMASLGMRAVTDGYGLYPCLLEGIVLVPQLFATPRALPMGVYTFCLHVNGMSDAQVRRVAHFLDRYARHVVPFSEVAGHVFSCRLQAPAAWFLRNSLRAVRRARA